MIVAKAPRRSLCCTAVAVGFALAAHSATVPVGEYEQVVPVLGQNMLANGDFERDTDGDGMPDEWGNVEHWRKTTRAEVRQARLDDGTGAIRVRFLTDGGCVINYLLREVRRYFRPPEPADLYHALSVKHQGHGVVYGHTIDARYCGIGSTPRIRRPGDWRTGASVYRYDPAQHEGIAMVRIYIRGARAGDTYWVDDYVLRIPRADEIDALRRKVAVGQKWRIISTDEAGKAKGVSKGNLLGDSSFESNPNYCRVRDGMKWWALGGRLVAGGAFHGNLAMADRAVSDPYTFRECVPHTVSLYAKGTAGSAVSVSVENAYSHALAARRTFRVTDDWQRHWFSFVPVPHVEALQAALRVSISGQGCLIDAVQLEEGGPRDYTPPKLELSVLVKRRRDRSFVAFFHDDERIPILVSAQARGESAISVRVVVRDFWMGEVLSMPLHLELPGAARSELLLGPLPRGAYRVHVEAEGVKCRSVQFGVISRDLADGSEICGGSHETGRDFNRHFVAALGLTWSRHHAAYTGPYWGRPKDVPWLSADYWASAGTYLAKKAQNPKLRHWGSFVYPPEPWRTELKRIAGSSSELPEGFFRNSREYFSRAVPRFSKVVKYWECWNEPVAFTPKQYLQMLTRFSAMIKRSDPTAKVVGFSGFFSPTSWDGYMVPLMKMGALKHCDVISYHGYWNDWPEDKLFGHKPLREHLRVIRNKAAAAGKPELPVWDNEFFLWGTSWYDDERPPARVRIRNCEFDYRTGAAVIVHYVTIAYAHGVRHFGPHCFDHDVVTKAEGTIEYDCRGFEYDYGLKPKTVAYAVVCHKLEKARLVHERVDGDLFAYVFAKPQGSLAVVFTRHGRPAQVELPGTVLEFRNIFDGQFSGVRTERGRYVVSLVGEPVYVECDLPAAQLAGFVCAAGL